LDIVSLITYSYYGRPALMSVCFFGSPPRLSSIVRQYCILCFWQINTLSLSLLHLPSAEAVSVRPSARPRM